MKRIFFEALKTPKGFLGLLIMLIGLIATFILPTIGLSQKMSTTIGLFTGLTSILGGNELIQAISMVENNKNK